VASFTTGLADAGTFLVVLMAPLQPQESAASVSQAVQIETRTLKGFELLQYK